jgi:HEAT repeat protein
MKFNSSSMVGLLALALLAGCSQGEADNKQLAQLLQTSNPQHYTAFKVPDEIAPLPSTRPLFPIAEPYVQVWTVKETAADALGRIGEPAVPALIQALSHPDPEVREQAGRAISLIGPKAAAAVPELVRLLDDESDSVRRQAARALGQIGAAAKAAVPALIKQLERREAPGSDQAPALPDRRPQARRG